MIDFLLEPFSYDYMVRAIWASALIGGTCAFLSCYLMLKGWALMGDALAHAIVPGVVVAYLIQIPYAIGAFFAGILAALSMVVVKQKTKLKEDATIGLVFTSFFAAGLLMVSINPAHVDVTKIMLGNVLSISDFEAVQLVVICALVWLVLSLKWRDLMLLFFDEGQAGAAGLPVFALKVLFFCLLSVTTVAALQSVGACLVIALVITPGATAYLLTDRFSHLIVIAVLIGTLTSALGAYLSYFFDGATGGFIVSLQTFLFLAVFVLAPKYGFLVRRQKPMERARHA